MGFKTQEHWINSHDPAAPQSNSTFLEIGHFKETATGSVKLGKTFLLKLFKKYIFPRNPVVPSELECIVLFLFDQSTKRVA